MVKQIEAYPKDYDARMIWASLLINEEKRDEAYAEMESIARENPLHVDALKGLADGYMKQQRYEEAETYAKMWVEARSKDPEPAEMLGDIYKDQGRFDEARKAYERCIVLDPSEPRREILLVGLDVGMGNFEAGAKALDRLWEQGDEKMRLSVYSQRAYLARMMGQPREALAQQRGRLEAKLPKASGPEQARLYSGLLPYLVRAGELEEAERTFELAKEKLGSGPMVAMLQVNIAATYYNALEEGEKLGEVAREGVELTGLLDKRP